MPARSKNRSPINYNVLEPRQLLAADLSTATIPTANYFISDIRQETVARDYLADQLATATLQAGGSDLALVEIQRGLASTVTRFQQTVHGIPVVGAWVSTIQGPTGDFVQVHDQSREGVFDSTCSDEKLAVDFAAAEKAALSFAGAVETFAPTRGHLAWLPGDGVVKSATLVWETTVFGVTADNDHGDFLTYVDAGSGEVVSQENRIAHFTEGSGETFYPHPYQTQGSGTGLSDSNDANSTALQNQLVAVTLEGLDEGTGLLTGEFVDLATLNSSSITDVDANEATRVYNYTRDDARFEQVQIYHTVDQINRYFHSLGFDDDVGTPNGIRDFPTLANAHWFGDDQSFYSSGNDAIHFGDGGVDDGEDGDIIAHEYGHAIQHDQNASWGGGEMGAMGEGFGDYLAASFFQDVGDAAFQSLHAAAVGEWDATSYSSDNPPNLRRVDGNKMYPDDTGGGVHADGEIWSRALWDLNQDIGAAAADQLVLESHFMVPANASMVSAAEMVLLADQNLNAGLYQSNIRAAFEARGILEAPATIGSISLNSSVYAIGDTIGISVVDGNGPASIQVTVASSNGDAETLSLSGTGAYNTTIDSVAGSPVANDGQLQAALGDTFTVTYVDTDDGSGGSFPATDAAVFQDINVYNSADTPIPISDNNTIESTITIADEGVLLDVDLQLNITHTWDGDLTAVLTAPTGQQVTLFDRIGSSGDDYTDTYFDEDAAASINSGTAPFTGSFRPDESFAVLDGISITGDWVLSITDAAAQDTGTLDNWSLYIVVEAPQTVGPISDSDAGANEVAEDATIGDSVGITASATDPDDAVAFSLVDDAGGLFSIDASTGVVTVAASLDYETSITHSITVRADSDDGSFSEKTFTIAVNNINDAVVSTRQIYYQDSSFDGGNDFDAVANDKQFLLSGQTATFANYSSYMLGLNGLALEVNDLNQEPTLSNIGDFFEFRVGNDDTPSDWAAAPAPTAIDYQSNVDASGTDRVALSWANNAIENQWLQITIFSGDNTGLASPDVFYFGNAIGETGNSTGDALVNADDISEVRQNLSGFFGVDILNSYDIDRNGFVNADDIGFVRSNLSGFFSLSLITPGVGKAGRASFAGPNGSVNFDPSYGDRFELKAPAVKTVAMLPLAESLELVGSKELLERKLPTMFVDSSDRTNVSVDKVDLLSSVDKAFGEFEIAL